MLLKTPEKLNSFHSTNKVKAVVSDVNPYLHHYQAVRTIDMRRVLLLHLYNLSWNLPRKERRSSKMNAPIQLEEYRLGQPKFTNAAHRFKEDRSHLNYDGLIAACEPHQRVTASACAFAREVIETTDPVVIERYRSQLRPYMNANGAQLGVMEEKPEGEIAPTRDLYALRLLQDDPELMLTFEQSGKEILEKLASTLELWNTLYRQLYSFVFWDGRALPVWSS
jgi:hypothetical protein